MTRLARAVFLALVGATFGAFWVAQELKSRPMVVRGDGIVRVFSPDGDGVRDTTPIGIVVQEADELTVSVVDEDGDEVRRLVSGVRARPGRPLRTRWDGRTDAGARAPDGRYRLRVSLREQARSAELPRGITLDTQAPRPLVRRVGARVVTPGRPVDFRIAGWRAPTGGARVWRTDVAPARPVAGLSVDADGTATWDGRVDGAPAPPGVYLAVAEVRDRAGNAGTSVPGLPALPRTVRGRPGVTVRALAARVSTSPVRAGRRAELFVDARGRRYAWELRRLGERRPVARGATRDPRLRVRAPRGPSGVHVVTLRSGGHRVAVPLLVQSGERAPLLVVLPAMSWLGRVPADEDGDGLPNTLIRGGPVPLNRLQTALPAGFRRDVAPLLEHLDRSRIRYDLTTDVALAASRDPRPTDRDAVLLAGPLTWVGTDLAARLRRYASGGGRVASFGVDSLRRGVTVRAGALVRPTAPAVEDAFGARLLDVRAVEGVSLEAIADDPALDLLVGTDGALDGFTRMQEARLGRRDIAAGLGEQVSAAEIAGTEEEGAPLREPLPALEAARLGDGLVVRVGLPEWVGRIEQDREVAQVHRNILDIVRGRQPRPRSAFADTRSASPTGTGQAP